MAECLFCRIASRELSSDLVFEDEQLVAIRDINPVAPVHVLLIPKRHVGSLAEVAEGDAGLLGHLQLVASRLARELGLDSYRVVNNCGAAAGQSVFHLHYHLLGGREFRWPPG
ncbi:MAG: histidine triad nucleotide-binding protein [Syntrophomonadaceae bacterium]|nr:histidine triad nucleotide-binding protein [Syntrophomonadaceae bacterium]MDH7497865.1 histidine triad nucleotide-binding protein [Syntrophomonadaceae bacterium]